MTSGRCLTPRVRGAHVRATGPLPDDGSNDIGSPTPADSARNRSRRGEARFIYPFGKRILQQGDSLPPPNRATVCAGAVGARLGLKLESR